MRKSMKDLVAEANARVETIPPAEAQAAQQTGDVILDVREPAELESEGRLAGAIHIPRGLLENRADADTPSGHPALVARRDGGGRVHVLCAAGGRAALAADSLRQMGYAATVIEGGLTGWKEAGLLVET